MAETTTFQSPPGLIALTSPGAIRVETAMALLAATQSSVKAGLPLEIRHFGGSLVDKARNDACRHLLANPSLGYVLFIDGDMSFAPESVVRLVHGAYAREPHFDVLGAYCVLRGNAAPTIDTGTGTWEKHFTGSGTLEVIRTGAAFLLVKRHVLMKMGAPWFACRHPVRWLDAFAEVDNFARTKTHGANPFWGPEWERLLGLAAADGQSASSARPSYEVGEDSGFCDRAKSLGFRIGVDTNLSIDHIDIKPVNGVTFKERIDESERSARLLHGVLR